MPLLTHTGNVEKNSLSKKPSTMGKGRPLSLRLLNKAEISLGMGALFGMLAMISIVFLPMSFVVSSIVLGATMIAGLSAVAAVSLLIASSLVIDNKPEKTLVEQKKLSVLHVLSTSHAVKSTESFKEAANSSIAQSDYDFIPSLVSLSKCLGSSMNKTN